MRTTLELNDELYRRAKRKAADEKLTLREVVEQALRAHLSSKPQGREGYSFKRRWKPVKGEGLMPGLTWEDLADRNVLFDIMDGRR